MGFLPSLDKDGNIIRKQVSAPPQQQKSKWNNRKKKKKRRFPTQKRKPLSAKEYWSYIKSRRWNKMRRRYYARNPNCCKVCGSKEDLSLHHITYERLGMERDEDLVPLCGLHHERFHDLIGGSKRNMRRETRHFIQSEQHDILIENIFKNL